MSSSLEERVKREKEQYNSGLKRDSYNSLFSHCTDFTNLVKEAYLIDEMAPKMDGRVLEIGCDCWYGWLHNMGLKPKEIHSINISETELEIGKQNLGKTSIEPIFHVMDAHKLEFPDNHFDLVFGGALLHHLDLSVALDEIKRVLKPGGKMVFWEPLRLNPLAIIARKLTPKVRTVDERPFGFSELKEVSSRFNMRIIPFELFVTPVGVLSKLLFKKTDNWLMRTAYFCDRTLVKLFPPIKYFYRTMILIGETI